MLNKLQNKYITAAFRPSKHRNFIRGRDICI